MVSVSDITQNIRRSFSRSFPSGRYLSEVSYVDKLNYAIEWARKKANPMDEEKSPDRYSDEMDEDDEFAGKSTTTTTQTEKLTKYKMIRKILQTEKSLKMLEKKTENLIHARVKYYMYWEDMMDRIKVAKRKNCILKKKSELLKLEVNRGLWEAVRLETIHLFNNEHRRSFDLQALCNNTLQGVLEAMDAESMEYNQTRKNMVKERYVQFDKLITLFVECRKSGMDENEFNLLEYGRLLKKKEEKLKATWVSRYSELNEQIKRAKKYPILAREKQCKIASRWNEVQLQKVLEEYKELITKNFSNIKSLTHQLYQKLCYERHAKKLKEVQEAQLTSAKARMFESKEKCSEMKRLIPSGKFIRENLMKALHKRKTLCYKHTKISIEKEYMAARKEKATEKIEDSWDEIKKLFFEGKRRCFKQIHAAMESQKHQNLSLLIFAQTIESWWNLHLIKEPHEEQKECSFPERGVTIATVLNPIPTIDYLEKEYKQTITLYDSALRIYVEHLQTGCMAESDLALRKKKRKIVHAYNKIVNEEKRVFSLIQTDMENAGRGT